MHEPFYENFEAALKKLVNFCDQFDGTEIQRAGVIQAFEFTFEQCWKAIQKKAGSEGITIASPKKAFEWAFQAQWIPKEREENWIEMLTDRNLTSHTYREAMAEQVSNEILTSYKDLFLSILDRMKAT